MVVLVTRKGAICAGAGEWGIIPGSMGTSSYNVQGLGSAESFESAAHGAGRRMSCGKARKSLSLADLEAQTAGVSSRKDAGVIDEIPGAYKAVAAVARVPPLAHPPRGAWPVVGRSMLSTTSGRTHDDAVVEGRDREGDPQLPHLR